MEGMIALSGAASISRRGLDPSILWELDAVVSTKRRRKMFDYY
tara:strand:+ start:3380 stop:3508 length:129 start_codon:yes stop_codon:yes gene_type:complete